MFNDIVNELTIEDSGALRVMMRKKYEDFLVILNHIEKDITPHQVTGGNTVIIPKARFNPHIAISCKRRDFRSLAYQYRISRPAISYIVAPKVNTMPLPVHCNALAQT